MGLRSGEQREGFTMAGNINLGNEELPPLENAGYIGLPIPDNLKGILAQLPKRDDNNY